MSLSWVKVVAVYLLLASYEPAYAGYSVYVRQQVAPKYITVYTAYGTDARLNPGTIPGYPTTFSRKVCTATDIYSSSETDRSEVWEDSAGISTGLFAACPQAKELKKDEIRTQATRRLVMFLAPYNDLYALQQQFIDQIDAEMDFTRLMAIKWE